MQIKTLFISLFVALAASCAGNNQQGISMERPGNGSSKANESHIDGLVRVGDSPPIDSPAVTIQCIGDQTCWINTPRLLWRSMDAGKNWQEIHRPSQDEIQAFSLVTSNVGWLISLDKVFMTNDGGLTWTERPSPLRFPDGEARSLWFLDDGQTGWLTGGIYRPQTLEELRFGVPPNTKDVTGKKVLQEVIYRTTDGGNSWEEQSLPRLIGRIMQARFLNKAQGVALGDQSVYYTTNSGHNWERAIFKKNCIQQEYFSEYYEARPRNVFMMGAAGVLIGYDDGRVLKSGDYGRSWCDFIKPGEIQFEAGANQPQYFTDLYFQSEEQGWGLGWDRFLYRTTDGGKRWKRVTSRLSFDSMYFSKQAYALFLSRDGVFTIAREGR